MSNHLLYAAVLCFIFNMYFILANAQEEGDVKLVGLVHKGRVEIYHGGQWGTVCDDQFHIEEAKVICRQLGFEKHVKPTHRASDGRGTGPIWMDGLKCNGDESSLKDCSFNGWGRNDCSHREDAGVECEFSEETDTPTAVTNSEIRLSCPPDHLDKCNICSDKKTICSQGIASSTGVRGIVEVKKGEEWHTLSGKNWSKEKAKVICGQLGYPDALETPTLLQIWPTHFKHFCYGNNIAACSPAAQYKRQLRSTVCDSLRCIGTESNIGYCNNFNLEKISNDPTVNPAIVHCGYTSAENSEECDKEGEIYRLRAGVLPWMGRVEVRKNGKWGTICDTEWDLKDASIVCRNLGYGTAKRVSHRSSFGRGIDGTHYIGLRCDGNEKTLAQCEASAAAVSSYCPEHSGDAGVECNVPQCDKEPSSRITNGVIEINGPLGFGAVCDDGINIDAANVVCRESEVLFAKSISVSDDSYTGNLLYKASVECEGDELNLKDCKISTRSVTKCQEGVIKVICTAELPDLVPNLKEFQNSLLRYPYLDRSALYYLTCAREENCLSSSANGQSNTDIRKLLRFNSLTMNYGTADFSPALNRENWIWHQCHNHYHSFENFITYDVLNREGIEVAEGHKASFCLEDSLCDYGAQTRYRCSTGIQGISKNCGDLYARHLDCQWIDITDNEDGSYLLRQTVNADRLSPETDYRNNEIECEIDIQFGYYIRVFDCRHSDH